MSYLRALNHEIEAMVRGAVLALPMLAVAVFILAVTYIVARLATRFTSRLTAYTSLREALQQLLETLVRLAVWIFGILVAATVVVPGFTPAGLFAGLGIGAVAIGFAFQDIFQNFLAGVLIMLRDTMRIGDVIECQNITGRVERVSLRETHVRQLSNELTIVPNTLLFKNPVKVLTDETVRRLELEVGVGYDTNLEEAEAAIRRAIKGVPHVQSSRAIEVYATKFAASSIDFTVRFWSDSAAEDFNVTRSQAIYAIKRALDKAAIEIPFPQVSNLFKQPLPLTNAARDAEHPEPASRHTA